MSLRGPDAGVNRLENDFHSSGANVIGSCTFLRHWRKSFFFDKIMPPSCVTIPPLGDGAQCDTPGLVTGNTSLSVMGGGSSGGAKPPGASEFFKMISPEQFFT
jgi:hypothetical protein